MQGTEMLSIAIVRNSVFQWSCIEIIPHPEVLRVRRTNSITGAVKPIPQFYSRMVRTKYR